MQAFTPSAIERWVLPVPGLPIITIFWRLLTKSQDANSYMKSIGYRLIDKKDLNSDGEITITTSYNNTTVPKGIPLVIEWDYKQENAVINKVDIAWTLNTDNVKNFELIVKSKK